MKTSEVNPAYRSAAEWALSQILDAYLGARSSSPTQPLQGVNEEGDVSMWCPSKFDMIGTPFEGTPWSTATLFEHPISTSLRLGIKQIGAELFRKCGHTGLMSEVLESVARMDTKAYARRASVLDHAWDGIGDWHA